MLHSVEERDLTPLMRQYLAIKKKHPDKLLLYRMGDFYELFFDDAVTASRELEITLTSRDRGVDGERIPLAGVPYHALDTYLPRLVKKGYKVVIAEQMEDPKKAKGLVKRDIVRIVTPGTLEVPEGGDERSNTFVSALVRTVSDEGADLPETEESGPSEAKVVLPKASYGLSHIDVSTGDFLATEITGGAPFQRLVSELMKYQPAELLVPESLSKKEDLMKELRKHLGEACAMTAFPDHNFLDSYSSTLLKEHFKVLSLEGLGLSGMPLAASAAGAALAYARENQMCDMAHVRELRVYGCSDFLVLDSTTLRNLEVLRSFRDGSTKGTLLEVLDQTRTAMGGRLLKEWMKQPLLDIPAIGSRLDAVWALSQDLFLRSDLKEHLSKVPDIERLMMRLTTGRGSARDLVALKAGLEALRDLKGVLASNAAANAGMLGGIKDLLDPPIEAIELISRAIVDEPPLSTKEGGMIKRGYSKELDEIASAASGSKEWLKEFESEERKRTGIKTLKVRYNSVFGYFIEVTKSHLSMVPPEYIRKQTIATGERFMTTELKEKEAIILNSEERMAEMELEIFGSIVRSVLEQGERIHKTAKASSKLDVLLSLSEAASRRNYCRPRVDRSESIVLKRSRHPVIEDRVEWGFVPNDLQLDGGGERFMILTGPNMAGKSTYMRQVALIVIMAQMGSFVPAEEASIGLVDRIFTRVGASDDLVRGQSTFMVEMLELANIMNSATSRSLVLLDEIGRGTSTFDGLAIAWAVTEHISDRDKVGCKAIFATHYHHLTELEGALEGVVNYSMSVKEDEKGITFLRKVKKGPASRSYGIEVASLAGIPQPVVERAREVLRELEVNDTLTGKTENILVEGRKEPLPAERAPGKRAVQMVLFPTEEMLNARGEDPVREELEGLDLNNLTPLQAMEALYRLKKKL